MSEKVKVFYLYELDPGVFPFRAKFINPGNLYHNQIFTIISKDGICKENGAPEYDIKENIRQKLIAYPEKGIGWTSETNASKLIDKAINNLFIKEKV